MKKAIFFLVAILSFSGIMAQKQQILKADKASLNQAQSVALPSEAVQSASDAEFYAWYSTNGFVINADGKAQPAMKDMNNVQSSSGDALTLELLSSSTFNITEWPTLTHEKNNTYVVDQNSGSVILFYSFARARVLYERDQINQNATKN